MTTYPGTTNAERQKTANRYGNSLPTAAKRRYAFAYLGWLRNHAVGYEPERGAGVTVQAAAVIREMVNQFRLWED